MINKEQESKGKEFNTLDVNKLGENKEINENSLEAKGGNVG